MPVTSDPRSRRWGATKASPGEWSRTESTWTRGADPSAQVGPQKRGRVLILVQNLSVPFDRRVWLECQSLTAAGFQVAVVCPKAPGDPTYYRLRGVELFKYRPYAPGTSSVSFVLEYVYSFIMTLMLSLRASFRGRFDIVQSCNPPDLSGPLESSSVSSTGRPSCSITTISVQSSFSLASRTEAASSTEVCG